MTTHDADTPTHTELTLESLRGEVDTLQRQLSEARDVNERLTFALQQVANEHVCDLFTARSVARNVLRRIAQDKEMRASQ